MDIRCLFYGISFCSDRIQSHRLDLEEDAKDSFDYGHYHTAKLNCFRLFLWLGLLLFNRLAL